MQTDPEGLQVFGSPHEMELWRKGINIRVPDYFRVEVNAYVFSFSRTLAKNGQMYFGSGLVRQYPSYNPRIQASLSMGWLNQCKLPRGEEVENHLGGYGMAGAAGYYGLGGGISWSPSNGSTSTEMGVGIGGGFSPGEIGSHGGNWGSGWE